MCYKDRYYIRMEVSLNMTLIWKKTWKRLSYYQVTSRDRSVLWSGDSCLFGQVICCKKLMRVESQVLRETWELEDKNTRVGRHNKTPCFGALDWGART